MRLLMKVLMKNKGYVSISEISKYLKMITAFSRAKGSLKWFDTLFLR